MPVAAQHRPGRHVDRRQSHRDRAHDEARGGLVAAAHQHRAVDRMTAQKLLAFHSEEISIEHGRRFDERLGERHCRQFDGKTAGLPDAAFHVFGAVAQMPVTSVDVAPGVEDADHRLAGPIVAVVAELPEPRAMAERAQIIAAEPAVAAQFRGCFCPGIHGHSDQARAEVNKVSTHRRSPTLVIARSQRAGARLRACTRYCPKWPAR